METWGKELIMSTLTTHPEQTAGTLTGPPDSTTVYAVVGFDGSASSLRALDAAAQMLNNRPDGGMEVVYVPHLSALITAGDVSGRGSAEVLRSFDDATRELSDGVRAHLEAIHPRGAAQRWHFQRRDGAIAEQLIAAADDLRRRHGADAWVVIVVGRPEHGYHHVAGSVPQALERHAHYPVIVMV
jgi:nucleotide-binding universal stress UspA family protein